MHLAQERINGSEIASIVGKQVDLRLSDMEEPGLAIMRIGSQDSCTDEIEWPSGRGAPIIPRFVRGSLAGAEHALISCTPDPSTDDQDECPGACKSEHFSPTDFFMRRWRVGGHLHDWLVIRWYNWLVIRWYNWLVIRWCDISRHGS